MPVICQHHLPFTPWMEEKSRKLPGIAPVAAGEWLIKDEVYDQQMAYKDHLLTTRREQVFQAGNSSLPAQNELLETLMAEVGTGFRRTDGALVKPHANPIITAARLVQEDLLILENNILTAAVLCFPASWTLSEKFGRNMFAIHDVVPEYDDNIAKRVERLFQAIRPEQPLWRANFMIYADPELHQPKRERETRTSEGGEYIRVERQTLRKLPKTNAIIFGIHTYVVHLDNITVEEREMLLQHVA